MTNPRGAKVETSRIKREDTMRAPALAIIFALSVSAAAASASTISFAPGSVSTVAVSSTFGTIAPGGTVGANYIAYGVDFTYGASEGIFDDPPLAFLSANSSGILDLVSPVDGRIVLADTTTQGVTNFFSAEAGLSPPGALTLTAFDVAGNIIQSVFNGNPLGPNGRTTFSISAPGVAAFRISGANTFGVDGITLNTPTAVAQTPIPAALSLFASALGGLGYAGGRRRKSALAAAP
jgi:hypothetical protein